MKHHWTRREFVRRATLLAASAPALSAWASSASVSAPEVAPLETSPGDDRLYWLDRQAPTVGQGVTWGRAWPQGAHTAQTRFKLSDGAGKDVPLQSWPLAFWPDGSLKWTGHAAVLSPNSGDAFRLEVGDSAMPALPWVLTETVDRLRAACGSWVLETSRSIASRDFRVQRDGTTVLDGLTLRCKVRLGSSESERIEELTSQEGGWQVEQAGPIRIVLKLEGKHRSASRSLLPFVLRAYLYAGSECIRFVHTIINDAKPEEDYISGIGISFVTPQAAAWHDRHIRISGQADGVFGEAVRGLTGLRRDPGVEVRNAQVAGEATPPIETWNAAVSSRLDYVPAYDDWTLLQSTADGFEIRKRTQAGCAWLTAARGSRAGGLLYFGSPKGGLALGVRNFWQSYPGQLDVRGARTERAELTAWLWAPDVAPMDLRPYHDGLGQDTFEKQYNGGLEITYEDYEPGFNTPEGIARTSELHVWTLTATPSRLDFARLQASLEKPPLLVSTPAYLEACQVFGRLWSPVDRSTPERAELEDKLDAFFEYYHKQQEERRWYGFWDFGDVMHTYDNDRHEWRYDIGGYAWDNSELSTDLWLWLYFLKTGRADAFRFAEAMTRHTGEVDVHHSGRFAPLGSRHNVQHWGCSAKQLRISTALNRRYYYYLTADERVGDLMREQVEAGWALLRVPPGRKLKVAVEKGDLERAQPVDPESVGLSIGTDWGSMAGAWLTEWERTRDERMRQRLEASLRTIGALPHGFFSAGLSINLRTGEFAPVQHKQIAVSHLNAVFGLVEVCAELVQLFNEPGFKRAWLDYCELYNASPDEQRERLGQALRGTNLKQGHARLTAYAAALKGDAKLAERAWAELGRGEGAYGKGVPLTPRVVAGPGVLRPITEAPEVSTNSTAQWGLSAIQCLALLR